ncbi:MAG: Uma2 family endonuclease [Desulfobacterales bacterium]|nr:Uma2 family endonuclease [Desulfobacterales bacterium]
MLAEKINVITEKEYLEIERASKIRHEYHDGEIFSMAGASGNHNLIISNIIRELGNQLRKTPCRVFPSDMKLRVEEINSFVYPDIMIVCGEIKFFDNNCDVLLDADLIIEVLSDSTESYDRGKKFSYYRQLKSFKEYLLISQKERRIQSFFKNEKAYWQFSEANDKQDEIILESIGCKLKLDDVYDKLI